MFTCLIGIVFSSFWQLAEQIHLHYLALSCTILHYLALSQCLDCWEVLSSEKKGKTVMSLASSRSGIDASNRSIVRCVNKVAIFLHERYLTKVLLRIIIYKCPPKKTLCWWRLGFQTVFIPVDSSFPVSHAKLTRHISAWRKLDVRSVEARRIGRIGECQCIFCSCHWLSVYWCCQGRRSCWNFLCILSGNECCEMFWAIS